MYNIIGIYAERVVWYSLPLVLLWYLNETVEYVLNSFIDRWRSLFFTGLLAFSSLYAYAVITFVFFSPYFDEGEYPVLDQDNHEYKDGVACPNFLVCLVNVIDYGNVLFIYFIY